MTKTDTEAAIRRAKQQVENTSGGGQLAGTYYGQEGDAKILTAAPRHKPGSGGDKPSKK